MKQKKQKAIVKEQKKTAKKELTAQIATALASVINGFSGNSKKIEKLISKNAKQLAKKLSKGEINTPTVEVTPTAAETPAVIEKKPSKKSVKA